ncbi:MAG TPA: hypothetical protein VE088_03825 [Gaiellaceae bacterium]|nr:hypothetical protein [Gaiellaceae bacterium]
MTRRTWISVLAALVVVGFGVGAGVAFIGSGANTNRSGSPSVEAVLSTPRHYYGRSVVISGTVNAVFGDHALTLGKGTRRGLLVTAKSPPLRKIAKVDSLLRITGTVRKFEVPAWEQWSGSHRNLRLMATFNGRPVVRATKIAVVR